MTLKAHEESKSSTIEDEDKKGTTKKEKKQKEHEKSKEKEALVSEVTSDEKEEKDPMRAYFKGALRDQGRSIVDQLRKDMLKHESE